MMLDSVKSILLFRFRILNSVIVTKRFKRIISLPLVFKKDCKSKILFLTNFGMKLLHKNPKRDIVPFYL